MHAADTASPNETLAQAASSARLPTIAEVEQQLITERLELFNGNKSAVARSLGISLKTLYNRLAAYRTADR